MYWWKEFDGGEVEEEFAHISALGLQAVRFFLLWEDFQPQPDTVDTRSLQNLVTVLDIAARYGLRATPTLLVGNMSNVQWWPPWAYTEEPERSRAVQISAGRVVHRRVRSVFSDPLMLAAEERLAREVSVATSGHPALEAWDLANEIDQIRPPRNPGEAGRWTERLSRTLRGEGTDRVTVGAHPMSLTTDGLTVPAMAPSLDYLAMHGYPLYSPVARGPLDTDFVPFVTALTAALGGKPCLMQEFGVSTSGRGEPSRTITDWMLGKQTSVLLVNEEEACRYLQAVLDRLWRQGAPGAFLWTFSDYSPHLWDLPPLDRAHRERYFGLLRPDGSAKPAAEMVQGWAMDLASGELERRLGPRGDDRPRIDLDPTAYYRAPQHSFREAYHTYLRAHA